MPIRQDHKDFIREMRRQFESIDALELDRPIGEIEDSIRELTGDLDSDGLVKCANMLFILAHLRKTRDGGQ